MGSLFFGACLYGICVLISFNAMLAIGFGAIIMSLAEIEGKLK